MSSRNNQGCGCFGCFSSLFAIMIILPLLLGGFLYIGLFALAIWLIYIILSTIWKLIKNSRQNRKLRDKEIELQRAREERQRKIKEDRELSERAFYNATMRNAELKKQDDNDNLKQYNDLTK
nr:hypothetical protein [uncultured Mediterraneibacter sp.]